jgi:hypothetical protein
VTAIGLPAVEDGDHVRVLEPGGGPRLAAEALHELSVLREALVQELERHLPTEHLVGGEPHVRHPAAAKTGDEHVAVADLGAPLQAHQCSSVAGSWQLAAGRSPRDL